MLENQGMSSGSRRCAGGGDGWSEKSSSSTQGAFRTNAGDKKDRVAPKCHCGVHAILYLSKTVNNPNRLFFGCPFFKKATLTHCKFFLWLDRHTEKLGNAGEHKDVEESEDVDAQFAMLGIENRITELEERLAAMEKKNKPL
ncbi:hypothetical protein PIB30_109662, partial [Stylosanthes scabra]|nr:hypothetical protein [Stylosanthes scabra]